MKTLILKSDRDSFERYCNKCMQNENVDTKSLYKYNSGLLWILEVIWIEKLRLPFQCIWYANWKKRLSKYSTIVVFDRNLNWNIIRYLRYKNPNININVWYWNITQKPFPDKLRKYCTIWSFDKADCEKYNYKWKQQFYFCNNKLINCNIKYDAVFVGTDKGRYAQVTQIENQFKKLGLKFYKHIIKDKNSKKESDYKQFLEYEKVIELMSSSKCIVDVPQQGQIGLTLRVLEALFFEKKLITTDSSIDQNDFYCKENIFIIGKDEYTLLLEFLNKPYRKITGVKEKYSFDVWSMFEEN